MALIKRFLKSDRAGRLISRLAAGYIRLVYRTSRWRMVGGEDARRLFADGKPFIAALWHGRLLMMAHSWPKGVPVHMLVSHHRDGRLIGDTIAHLGVGSVAGSTSKGGAGAVRAMVRLIRKGEYVGVTPDGPRGPRMRAQMGVAAIAKLSGVPVVPMAYATRRRRVLGSWDRFMVPSPFNRGVFVWGDPIAVPRDADEARLELARLEIERAMNAVTAEADRLSGHAPVPPAEAAPDRSPDASNDASNDIPATGEAGA